jgi:hypothetical protein
MFQKILVFQAMFVTAKVRKKNEIRHSFKKNIKKSEASSSNFDGNQLIFCDNQT